MTKYAIAWKSKITDKSSQGAFMFTKDDAENQCKKLNEKYPCINHWAQEER